MKNFTDCRTTDEVQSLLDAMNARLEEDFAEEVILADEMAEEQEIIAQAAESRMLDIIEAEFQSIAA